MRKIPVILAACAGLLLLVAAAAELLCGSWFSQEPLAHIGLARDTATTVSASGLYDGGGEFAVRRDHWGFRGDGGDPAQITILTVGGDTTAQTTLPDDATWQAVMARDLGVDGRTVTVANAGIDGQSTIGMARALAEWFPQVPALKPHFMLFSVGIEDARAEASDSDALRPAMGVRWLRQHSFLWQGGKRLLSRFIAPPPPRQDHRRVDFATLTWIDAPAAPDWKPEGDFRLDAYRERLRHLAQDSHAMGAVPVFITQTRADFRTVDGKVMGAADGEGGLNGIDRYRRLAAVNRATREVCADEGLLCLDLAREVTFEPGDFYDYVHNTPQGAAKIGHWLAGKLAGLV